MVKLSKKTIIIGVIVLLVLIGGGIGFYFYNKDKSTGGVQKVQEVQKGTEGRGGVADRTLKLKMKTSNIDAHSDASIQVLNGDDDTLIKKFPKNTFTDVLKKADKEIVFIIKDMKTLPSKLKIETRSTDGLVLEYVKIDNTSYGKDGKVGTIVVDFPETKIVTLKKIS